MPSTPFSSFTSHYAVLANDNIDTDQIIPARFLKTTERTGLGIHAFHDWRYGADGAPRPGFPLNDAAIRGASVLVGGRNFGCGSSREHAVWALMDAGFRAVISSGFADIFRGNALGNGLLPIEVAEDAVQSLIRSAEPVSGSLPSVSVDLSRQELTLPDGTAVYFPVPPFAKHCLLNGIDEMDFLVRADNDIAAYEASHPATVATQTHASQP